MRSRHGATTRIFSLLLTLTILFTGLPLSAAWAEKPQVSLSCDAGGAVSVGDTLSFTITGVNTAAVQLMVVTPDSRQAFFEGASVSYTVTQPGLHTFIAYGVNTVDNADPAQELCMSQAIFLTAGGGAATEPPVTPEPEIMSGQLVFSALADGMWDALEGQHFNSKNISVGVTLIGENVPADADIDITLHWKQSSRALVSEKVSGRSSWQENMNEAADMLLDGYYSSEAPLRVEAVVTAPDGQTITASANFTMDTFTNEMRYVNQFFGDNGVKSQLGLEVNKWLDMRERSDNMERVNSGYLLLEQEMLYQASGLYRASYNVASWGQKALETVGSFGLNLATEWAVDEWYYEDKFGDAGKKAYPYYTTLASVYSDYAVDLMAEIEAVANGAAVEESISANTLLWDVTYAKSAEKEDTADGAGKAFDTGEKLEKPLKVIENAIYCHNPVNANKNIFIMTSSSPVAGNSYTLAITDMMYETVSTTTGELIGYPVLTYRNTYGEVGQVSVAELSNRALEGDRLELDISALQSQGVDSDDFMNTIQAGTEQFLANTVSASAGGVLGYNKDFSFTVDKNDIISFSKMGRTQSISAELIDRYGLQQYLTDDEKFFYEAYRRHGYSKNYDTDYTPKVPDYIKAGISGVTTALSWKAYYDSRNYQSTLQRAYFSAFNSVSDKYASMLYGWAVDLEQSSAPDAEYQKAAIDALIADITATRDDSLQKMKDNVKCFTSAELVSAVSETITFAAGLVSLLPQVRQIKNALAGWAATKAAATIGVTQATTLLTTFTKLSAGAGVAGITSFVLGLITSKAFSFEEDVKTTYYLKWSLWDKTAVLMNEYAQKPTHQGAMEIIQALKLMKQLKYHGEDLIATYYLADLYDDFYLDSAAAQLVLWHELRNSLGKDKLNYNDYITQVWVIHENVPLGTVRELKDQDVKFDELGLFESEKNSTAVGDEVIGVYLYGGTPGDYQGIALEPMPEAYYDLPRERENALDFDGDYAIARVASTERKDWQSLPVQANNGRMYREKRYLYSRGDVEVLLTEEEFWEYNEGEEEVNRLMQTYAGNDKLGFFQFEEREDQQYTWRIQWLMATRLYIDSLHMYDPSIIYP